MQSYIASKAAMAVLVLFGVSVLVFAMVRLIPGDPARVIAGETAPKEAVEEIRRTLLLDEPLPIQYGAWITRVLRGDLGKSAYNMAPVAGEILARFPATLELTLAALAFSLVAGIPAGVLAATRRNSIADYLTMTIAVAGVSMPVFWLGLLLLFVFTAGLGWLPTGGRMAPTIQLSSVTNLYVVDSLLAGNWTALGDSLRHLVLPAVALGAHPLALVARMTRSSMLEVVHQDFVRTARSKGLSERRVVYGHALRNALIPVVTVVGVNVATLLSGAVLTETVFAWPGLGTLVVTAITGRDLPVVQGTVLFLAGIFVLVNLLVDVLYGALDPRIRYGRT